LLVDEKLVGVTIVEHTFSGNGTRHSNSFFDCGFFDYSFGFSGGFGHRMTSAHMLNAVEKKCDQTNKMFENANKK
jgi:hypothetical protein